MLSFREDNDPGFVIVEDRLCCLSGTGTDEDDEFGGRVEASKLSTMTMRAGVGLGVAAVLLVILNRLVIGNFGTDTFVEDAPVAMVVTAIYLLAIAACVIFSAVLVAASLIMRHAEALKSHSR
jgi:hypothetical protein